MARPFVPDTAIVRLLETAERDFARAEHKWLPDAAQAARHREEFEFAEGYATLENTTPGKRLARVTILALEHALTRDAFDALIARFPTSVAETLRVRVVRTEANAEVIAWLAAAGFRRKQGFVHWIAPTDVISPETAATAAGHGVRRITHDELPEFARIVGINYNRKPETATALIHESMMPETATFMAHVDGVAVATGRVTRAGQVCGLGYGTTLRPYRGRGIQQAIIAARLCHAHTVGCPWATASTMGHDRSSRNIVRQGLRKAYEIAVYERG